MLTSEIILRHARSFASRPRSSLLNTFRRPPPTRAIATQLFANQDFESTRPGGLGSVQEEDYSRSLFADRAQITVHSGSGGNGCISFLREKYLEHGPPNGGDGGIGGSIYIQATRGETSLHKLSRRPVFKAGRGQNGQGKSKGGQRGEDVLIQVPVGTVVREISRLDPVVEERRTRQNSIRLDEAKQETGGGISQTSKWLLYPSASQSEYKDMQFPRLPKDRRSHLVPPQPNAPIHMDLSAPMERPELLAAGAVGGCGNPHFISPSMPRPKIATKGDRGMTLTLDLELKLLADLGFVGMPNAGKSTLLRALSRSRARVGNWAFTTLSPNIGTMILDDQTGRPLVRTQHKDGEPRTSISIADIPGLIAGAHLDKGLGLDFLRHIERAKVLAFVIDLSSGDAVDSLNKLWFELAEFEKVRERQLNERTESRSTKAHPDHAASPHGSASTLDFGSDASLFRQSHVSHFDVPISTKPWYVVATKADLDGTEQNFAKLQGYLDAVSRKQAMHPANQKNAWAGQLVAIPVSAIKGEGVKRIAEWTATLLDDAGDVDAARISDG